MLPKLPRPGRQAPDVPSTPPGDDVRTKLIESVFRACDEDGDGSLSMLEMRSFAVQTGFDGEDEEWEEQFHALLSYGNPTVGIDLAKLVALVNDESADGCFCSNEELQEMLPKLPRSGRQVNGTETPLGRAEVTRQQAEQKPEKRPMDDNDFAWLEAFTPASSSAPSRKALADQIFDALDVNQDGELDMKEMRRFATLSGFSGGDDEWAEEFALLCTELGGVTSVDRGKFLQIVNESDTGALAPWNRACLLGSADATLALKTSLSGSQGAPEPCNAKSRGELIQAVFRLCDGDADNHLCEREMRSFATFVGFDGTAEEWAEEFRLLCADGGLDPEAGVDLRLFSRLVEDSSEKGCFCSDDELREALGSLRPAPPSVAPPVETTRLPAETKGQPVQSPTPAQSSKAPCDTPEKTPLQRSGLIGAVFRACDADGDGLLCREELRTFAGYVGFDGTAAEWEEEYACLCRDNGGDTRGLDSKLFSKLVNDSSNDGCYCTDEELRKMLRQLLPLVTARTREAAEGRMDPAQKPTDQEQAARMCLIHAVFHALDADGDNVLNSREMRRFADFCGFASGDDVWNAQFRELLEERGGAPRAVSLEHFCSLVEDRSDVGSFCDDAELDQLLRELVSERPGATDAAWLPPPPGLSPPEADHEDSWGGSTWNDNRAQSATHTAKHSSWDQDGEGDWTWLESEAQTHGRPNERSHAWNPTSTQNGRRSGVSTTVPSSRSERQATWQVKGIASDAWSWRSERWM